MKKILRGNMWKAALCFAFAMTFFIGTPSVSKAYVETTGIVSANAAKVRKEPSTNSDVAAGLLKGSTVTVTDEVTDSAGAVWYKVKAENIEGYIRSDLMIKATTSAGNTSTASNANSNSSVQAANNSKPAPTAATPIAETKAYVNYESVRVREGASTNHEIVGSVLQNTSVIITGEAKANDGKKWYQIKYTNQSGREVVGFVRGDLLTIGDPPVPVAEEPPADQQPEQGETDAGAEGGEENGENAGEVPAEAPAETPAEEPVPQEPAVKPDYEMVFTANNEGIEEWYLYDNINGTRQTLAGLLAAAEAGTRQSEVDTDQLSTQKIIIIVLAVLVAILAIIVTLLLFKIKDLYDDDYEDYDDDEDDEEDDEEEEEITVPRKRIASGVKAGSQVKSSRTDRAGAQKKETDVPVVKMVEYDPGKEEFREGKAGVAKEQPKRKAKNFLIDDDEFEFEFLNMDDK